MPRYRSQGPLDDPMVEQGDVSFARMNTRLRPDQLKPSEVAYSSNGRMDIDGAWQTRKGIESFGPTLTPNSLSIRLLATPTWQLYDATPISISAASRTTTTITVDTATPHGFSDQTLVNISGLTGTVDPNGNRLITVVDADTFTFTISGATGSETYGGTGVAKGAVLSGTQTTGVYASCLFSAPGSNNARYIILATNLNAVAIKLSDGSSTNIAYPTGVTISADADMIQAFDKVFIFINGSTALEWNGTLSGSPAFTRVSNGAYTSPVYYNASNNTVIADGVATVTEAAHGLSVGDTVYVVDNGGTELIEGTGDYERGYVVATVPGSGSFTVNAQVPDETATSVVWTKRISSGRGFTHMPAPAWGVYHQRRLWVPYAYTMAGTSGASPTITARNITDEIIASDILDSNTYDRINNQFRITAGVADYVVAVEPFAEDNLLVFNRSSIHLITGISGSLLDTSTRLITAEIGCVARRSIAQVGNQVLFLSDNGVYAAAFGDLYNLRGAGVPLSEPIDNIIRRINRNYASSCVAKYYNNRYYLAVPLDSSTTNNAILIYNFLNQGWESVDSITESAWDVDNLIVGDVGGLSKLYVVGSTGSVHILDDRDDGSDNLTLYAGVGSSAYPIASYVTTRQYSMGTMDRKKFNNYELHIESSDSEGSNGSIAIEVENPDSNETLNTISGLLGANLGVAEDASLRGRIGNKRGYGAQLVVTPTNGRPKVRAVKLSASITNPTITQAE